MLPSESCTVQSTRTSVTVGAIPGTKPVHWKAMVTGARPTVATPDEVQVICVWHAVLQATGSGGTESAATGDAPATRPPAHPKNPPATPHSLVMPIMAS